MKDRHIDEVDRERLFMQAKCDIEQTYSGKLLALYERVQRFEADSDQRLHAAEQRGKSLERENTRITQYATELKTKTDYHAKDSDEMRQKLIDLQHELVSIGIYKHEIFAM